LAPENDFKPYEVRRALVENCALLFTIDEKNMLVWVIGFRHGSRMPRPDERPESKPESEAFQNLTPDDKSPKARER
jgi:hypothetical protein